MTRKKHSKAGHAKQASQKAWGRPHGTAAAPLPSDTEELLDQPFAEGVRDELDPDLRHRLISEAAFHRQVERGYDEGYDREDWLDAEAAVDHVLVPKPD